MKGLFICGLFSVLFAQVGNAQQSEEKAITQLIQTFAQAGDQNDAEKLAACLDDNFRVVMNRLFGSEAVSIMPKEVYVEKIRSKEFGGDKRKVNVEKIVLNGNTASAKVILAGEKSTFITLLNLVQDADGNWLIVSDTPTIKA
jgi:ketosteroid isomerase-like protein